MSYRKYLSGSQKRKLAEERRCSKDIAQKGLCLSLSQKRKLAEERRCSKDIAQKGLCLSLCVTKTKTLKLHENRFSRQMKEVIALKFKTWLKKRWKQILSLST